MTVNEIQQAEAKPKQSALAPTEEVRALTPMEMITAVVQRGADPETLDRVTTWAKGIQADEARKAYAQALINFKALCPTVIRSGKGDTNTYAKLSDIDEQIRPILAQCQLAPTFRIAQNKPDWIDVECRLTHALGHFETTTFGGPPDTGPRRNALQARASTVSYLERYTLKALLGLVDKDMPDDDGAGGAPGTEKPKAKASIEASEEDKRKFYIACVKASGIKKPTGKQCIEWLGQVQSLSDLTDMAQCAAWMTDNGVIVDGKVQIREQADAREDVGVTDIKEEEPAPVSDPGKPYVCRKCGVLYRVNPARGICVAEDSDGFSCKGPVVKREEA